MVVPTSRRFGERMSGKTVSAARRPKLGVMLLE